MFASVSMDCCSREADITNRLPDMMIDSSSSGSSSTTAVSDETSHDVCVDILAREVVSADDPTLERDVLKELNATFRSIKNRKHFRIFIEEEGFEDVLDHMLCFSDSEAVQELCCNLLLHVVRIETGSMKTPSSNEEGREFWRLRLSRKKFDVLKTSLLDYNLVDILTLSMQSFPLNELIQNHVLTVLAKLVHPRYFTDRQQVHVLAIKALQLHTPFTKTVLAILSSLFSFCKHEDRFCQSLLANDVLAAIRLVMTIHDDNSEIMSLSCQLLFLLADKCGEPTVPVEMMDCLPAIISMLAASRTWRLHTTTMMAACGVIWHLANGNAETKRRIVLKTKTVSRLIRLVMAHMWDKDLMVMACGALCALSLSDDARVLAKLSESLLLDALGPVWYHHHNVELLIESVLVILIRIDDFRGRFTGPRAAGDDGILVLVHLDDDES